MLHYLLGIVSLCSSYGIAFAQNYTYDLSGRLTSAIGAGTIKMHYTYDLAGNIASIATNSATSSTNPTGLTISAPVVNRRSGTNALYTFSFTWSSVPGANYEVQFTTNLASTDWGVFGLPITATNTTLTASDIISTNRQRFYRVVLLP